MYNLYLVSVGVGAVYVLGVDISEDGDGGGGGGLGGGPGRETASYQQYRQDLKINYISNCEMNTPS